MLEDVDRADGMVQELEARRVEKKKEVIKQKHWKHEIDLIYFRGESMRRRKFFLRFHTLKNQIS